MPALHTPWSNKRPTEPFESVGEPVEGAAEPAKGVTEPGERVTEPFQRTTEAFEAGALESADFGADTEQLVQADDYAASDHGQHTGLLVGVGISVALLVLALVWILAMSGQHGSSPANKANKATSASTTTSATASGTDLGLTVGKVTRNDGSTLIVDGALGGTATVRTNADTRVLALTGGTRTSDVRVGDTVVVHGDKAADGSIKATLIIGAPLDVLLGN